VREDHPVIHRLSGSLFTGVVAQGHLVVDHSCGLLFVRTPWDLLILSSNTVAVIGHRPPIRVLEEDVNDIALGRFPVCSCGKVESCPPPRIGRDEINPAAGKSGCLDHGVAARCRVQEGSRRHLEQREIPGSATMAKVSAAHRVIVETGIGFRSVPVISPPVFLESHIESRTWVLVPHQPLFRRSASS